MPYKALTFLNLPPDNKKAPGDKITDKELKDAGQTEADIAALKKGGAIGSEQTAIDEAHEPVKVEGVEGHVNVITGDWATGDDANA